jgi:hypothetical protein
LCHEDLSFTFISGLREYFSQTDEIYLVPRIPVMHSMINVVSVKDQMFQEDDSKTKQVYPGQADNKSLDIIDEESEDDDDDY